MTEAPSLLSARVVRYALAGIFSAGVYFVSVLTLVELAHLQPVSAAVLATIVVLLTSYVVNRLWVFETNRSHASAFTRFALATLVGIGLNAGLMYLASDVLAWPYMGGALLAVVIVPPFNFVINQYWTFRAAPSSRP